MEFEGLVGTMQKKLSLVAGTALTATLFVFFHAVLAVGTIFWVVALIPAVLFKWSVDERKETPVQSIARRRDRI